MITRATCVRTPWSRTARGVGLIAFLAACGSGPPPPPSWHVVLSNLPSTLLCIWGPDAKDVFAVGGPLGNGSPSVVLHYDGAGWRELSPGGTETFWWAHGTSGHDLWVVGEKGRITHWDGAKFTEYASGTTATLYGVWAAAANDVWAVGGTVDGGTPDDVVLHFDGSAWSAAALPQTLGRTYFKVWGSAADNVYVVGEQQTIWHLAGSTWTLELQSSSPSARLTTVSGCSSREVYAVGNLDVFVSDGTKWQPESIGTTDNNGINGVACASPGHVAVVGNGGTKERLVDGRWQDDFSQAPSMDLHSVWADPSGSFWAAGGDFSSDPRPGASRDGVLAYYGSVAPSSALSP